MLDKTPKCPKCEDGYIYFQSREIESPFKNVPHLALTDMVCDKCSYAKKNIFDEKFNFTHKQIKELLESFGGCSITEFEEKWPCDSVDVFMELLTDRRNKAIFYDSPVKPEFDLKFVHIPVLPEDDPLLKTYSELKEKPPEEKTGIFMSLMTLLMGGGMVFVGGYFVLSTARRYWITIGNNHHIEVFGYDFDVLSHFGIWSIILSSLLLLLAVVYVLYGYFKGEKENGNV